MYLADSRLPYDVATTDNRELGNRSIFDYVLNVDLPRGQTEIDALNKLKKMRAAKALEESKVAFLTSHAVLGPAAAAPATTTTSSSSPPQQAFVLTQADPMSDGLLTAVQVRRGGRVGVGGKHTC